MSFKGILPWIVIAVVVLSFMPIWRNSPAKEGLNFWQFIREEPFKGWGVRRPHLTVEEAIRQYGKVAVVEPYHLIGVT